MTERAKNLREQSGKRESKKTSAAERRAEREVAERARSGERRSQKWALARSVKAARSASMLCTGVIESVLRKSQPASYIFVLIVYSYNVQSDSTTIKQSI